MSHFSNGMQYLQKKIDSYIKIAHHVRNKTTTSYIEGKRINKVHYKLSSYIAHNIPN